MRQKGFAFERGMPPPILEPVQWPFDGDVQRRMPVVDPIDGRIVRQVGWRKCLSCHRILFSQDVIKLRICDYCKQFRSD